MKHSRQDYTDRIQDSAGIIPADEPVFLIRTQDKLGPETVRRWSELARENGRLVEANIAKNWANEMEKYDPLSKHLPTTNEQQLIGAKPGEGIRVFGSIIFIESEKNPIPENEPLLMVINGFGNGAIDVRKGIRQFGKNNHNAIKVQSFDGVDTEFPLSAITHWARVQIVEVGQSLDEPMVEEQPAEVV